MNLKSAAKRLGVHYQTAYRYVRAGELIATRVGAGYEVSEAAIELFLARRATWQEAVPPVAEAPLPASPAASAADVRDELEALLAATTLSPAPVFDLVTRWLTEQLGDGCLLRLLTDDGQSLSPASFHHVTPAGRARLAALMSRWSVPVGDSAEGTVVRTGKVMRIDHVAVGRVARILPLEFRQYQHQMTVHSAVVVPVLDQAGRVRGTLTVWRGTPGRLYPAGTEALMEEMAEWVSRALERAELFNAGWIARDSLHARVEEVLRRHPEADEPELRHVLAGLLDDEHPEAVFALDRRVVVANEPFMLRFGIDQSGDPTADDTAVVPVCAWTGDELVWSRLVSGAVDFLDQLAAACPTLPSSGLSIHWAVARRPDATPVLVVATCAAQRDARDVSGVSASESACWGVCGGAARVTG